MKVVTLSTDLMLTLIRNKSLHKRLPPLANASKKLGARTRGCGRCNKRKNETAVALAVRESIIGWPEKLKARLKNILNADTVRFYSHPVGHKKRKPSLVEF